MRMRGGVVNPVPGLRIWMRVANDRNQEVGRKGTFAVDQRIRSRWGGVRDRFGAYGEGDAVLPLPIEKAGERTSREVLADAIELHATGWGIDEPWGQLGLECQLADGGLEGMGQRVMGNELLGQMGGLGLQQAGRAERDPPQEKAPDERTVMFHGWRD